MDYHTGKKLKFSRHAQVRQCQRDISDEDISSVIRYGLKIDRKDTTIYTDQNLKIVICNYSNTVLTVNKNTRNTRFLLSERTQQKEESLLYKVKKNNDHAMCQLADFYLNGELGKKDVQEAYHLFKRAADMGNSHAMCKISNMYQDGDLGAPNQELADRWMKKAADNNNTNASAFVGQRLLSKYLEKYPVKSKIVGPSALRNEILYYFTKSADKSQTRGMYQLGEIYEEGKLGEKDLSKALEWYVKAANLGSPGSLDSLYRLTIYSKFNSIEFEEILDYVSSYLPETSLGVAFETGVKQVNGNLGNNPSRGLNMLEQVAIKQYDEAIRTLAKCYRDGIACKEDLQLSQFWFNKLHVLYDKNATAGNVSSLWKLGKLFLKGYYKTIDLDKAEMCFKKCIEKSSDPDQIYNLGKLYLEGRLGDKPIENGIILIARAINLWKDQAVSGDTKVYNNIGKAYFFIKDFKMALYWLSQSSTDDVEAQIFLAKIYFCNLSSEKNISLGTKILENILLEHDVSPQEAFKSAEFQITDQTVLWLQDFVRKSESFQKPYQDKYREYIISTLANIFETGELNVINYDLASEYYLELLNDFNNTKAGKILVWSHIEQHLPTKYFDAVKNWVSKIPALLMSSELEWSDFESYILLLGKLYQVGDMLPLNIQKSAKWLYLASYIHWNNENETERIKHDLENLPPLDNSVKIQIVFKLSVMAKHLKNTSSLIYKVISQILGEIFYDNKIINQNIDDSIYWYSEAANMNNDLASFELGRIYRYDKEDINSSIKWYYLSLQQGNKDALNELLKLADSQKDRSLLLLLKKYKHESSIHEFELTNVKRLKNLDFYPKTTEQMVELAKSYLDSNKKDVLNAVYWFRTAMKKDNIEAALELYFMYKSGILGNNLIECAKNLFPDILRMCYYQYNKNIEKINLDISEIKLLLKNVSTVLKISHMDSANTLNQKLTSIIDQADNMNSRILKNIAQDLELIIREVYSQTQAAQNLAFHLLTEDVSNTLVL